MEKEVRLYVKIECEDVDLKESIGEYIHNQLKGYQDYRNNNILLNIHDDPYAVQLWIFKECKDVPKITLPDLHWRWKVPEEGEET